MSTVLPPPDQGVVSEATMLHRPGRAAALAPGSMGLPKLLTQPLYKFLTTVDYSQHESAVPLRDASAAFLIPGFMQKQVRR
jgi:hypothetical protein